MTSLRDSNRGGRTFLAPRSRACRSKHTGLARLPQRSFGGCLASETRMQVDAFLKEHEIYDYYTAADVERDRETLRQLR